MNSLKEWKEVLVLAVGFGVFMSLWGYIMRRETMQPPLRVLYDRSALSWAYLQLAIMSLDYGFLFTFRLRAFHGALLPITIAINASFVGAIAGFKLHSSARKGQGAG